MASIKRVKGGDTSCPQDKRCQERRESSPVPVPELPPEVIQHILEMGASLKLVKNCRLVSKTWNEISCTVLKNLAVVSIEEDNEGRLEQFRELLLDRQLGVSPEFPNPFQYYNIRVESDLAPSISKFIKYPNVRINVLSMTLDPTTPSSELKDLLCSCKPFLRQLSITGCCEDSEMLEHPELTAGWSSLKLLEFNDGFFSNIPKHFVKFIHALIQENPSLQQLSLAAGLGNVKKCLVSNKCSKAMLSLRSLFVNVTNLTRNGNPDYNAVILKEISGLEAPDLKEIRFHVSACYQTREDFQEAALTLVQRHSHKLKSLSTNLLDLHRIPALPQLETLSCNFNQSDKLEHVNSKNFPCLTALRVIPCFTEILELCKAQDTKPHVLLSSLDIPYPSGFEYSGPAAIWPILGRHFPRVTKISVSFRSKESGAYVHDILVSIGKWFPQLESLEFSSNAEIALFNVPDLENFSKKGWALLDVTNDPILGLKNLVNLELKDEVTLAPAFIRFGLPQLKNLRSLRFPWDEQILVPGDISEYLGLLTNPRNIVITTMFLPTYMLLRKLAERTSTVSVQFTGQDFI